MDKHDKQTEERLPRRMHFCPAEETSASRTDVQQDMDSVFSGFASQHIEYVYKTA